MCLHCTKNPRPRSLLSTQSFSHRSDNVTPSSSSHSVAVRNDIRHGTMRNGAVRPWGRSPQRHTTVQLTQSATTYDNYTSHSLRSLARMPQIRQVLHPSSYEISKKFAENGWNVISNARPIRPWSENDPSMLRAWSDHETVSPQPASQPRFLFTPTTSILYWKIQRFALRLSFQILPNTAPATKSDTWTSPNTAPATKNESHDWSLTQMKRYLQCAEQHASLSKLTKYCACHEK